MADCKQCKHYGFYQMITEGAYGYAGTIPCQNCKWFNQLIDNFEAQGQYEQCNCASEEYYKTTAGCPIHAGNRFGIN